MLVVKNLPASAGDIRDMGWIPGSGRSSWEGHSNPLQYSCLENPHGQRNLVGYIVHRVTKSWTRLKQLSNLATYAGHIFKTLLGPAQVPSVCVYSDAVPFSGGGLKAQSMGSMLSFVSFTAVLLQIGCTVLTSLPKITVSVSRALFVWSVIELPLLSTPVTATTN